jgi:hypothetical protein
MADERTRTGVGPAAQSIAHLLEQLDSSGLVELNPYTDSSAIGDALAETASAFAAGSNPVVNVGSDGIHMKTLNGDALLAACPSVIRIYDETLGLLRKAMPGLHEIPQRPIGISANYLEGKSDQFRMHFDRHQVTAIVYLNDVPSMPLVMYPNVRGDPILTGTKAPFDLAKMTPYVIEPRANTGVVFYGRRTYHGVENRAAQGRAAASVKRYSLQFGFDRDPYDYEGQSYYGASG